MSACRAFRQQLEAFLTPPRSQDPAAQQELNWHSHLLSCSACRQLLESEQALDLLLESLPSPQLPPFLTERVLLRLRTEPPTDPSDTRPGLTERVAEAGLADSGLDALLDLDREAMAPAGLAERVQAGLRARQEEALDRLLDEVGPVDLPVGLASRTQARLAPELNQVRRRRQVLRTLRVATGALAAGLLAVFGLWLSDQFAATSPVLLDEATAQREVPVTEPAALTQEGPDEELLQALPALELMGLLESGSIEDPSVLIGTSLDEAELAQSELTALPLGDDLWTGEAR